MNEEWRDWPQEYEDNMETADRLSRYLDYRCDSQQEAYQMLCHLVSYPDYVPDELYEQIIKAVRDQLKDFEDNWTIVKEKRTEVNIVEHLVENWRLD